MIGHVQSTEDNYEEIKRILAKLVNQLNQSLGVSLSITISPEEAQQLHEEYANVSPNLDIHNCTKFLIFKINEYLLQEALKQLKTSHREDLIQSELITTQQQIQTILSIARLNRGKLDF